jgi:H+-translocating NAD(P) transhydrogenase subunit alpha
MMNRWVGWTAVACALVALWSVVLRGAMPERELVLAQAALGQAAPREAAEPAVVPAGRSTRLEPVSSREVAEERLVARELRRERRLRGPVSGITIFVIAIFLGVELINRVPATLHTPLMSGSNAISGITVVGAIIAAGVGGRVAPFLGFVAVVLAMINVAGGFLVTHRMLMMFKRR